MAWCRMKFKPKKSRSLSIRKGKIEEAVTFTVAEQQIPTVSQEPVKSLGRWYDSSMKDTRRGVETVQFDSEGLVAINKCGITGKFKVWCLQFMLIPKLLWPLLVYDICCSTVESIEAKINKYTRKWLGFPPGLSDVAMYCRKAKLKLLMKSILEEYKCGKVRLVTMLEESDDPVVKTVQPSIKTGRNWKVAEAIDEAKECLRLKEVIGQTQTDRKGLGSSSVKWWSKTGGKEKRDMVIIYLSVFLYI
ncbi:reverse transcriptase [Elysia marginata]|uniref:Reverse transcriptase n=1 Tax=Elysia marginata TaxID=1093978 RepID=A0AAV4GKU6_9GAST|nr:reverse transcriptase [Elysia marginata]